MLNNNRFEDEIFKMFPGLQEPEFIVRDIKCGDTFSFTDPSNIDIKLSSIHTPGHISDHMSFLLNHNSDSLLFSGDIILGTPSTVVEDLPVYMDTLRNLRDNYKFDKVCVPHSVKLEEDQDVILDGPKKLQEYIQYREDRLS